MLLKHVCLAQRSKRRKSYDVIAKHRAKAASIIA